MAEGGGYTPVRLVNTSRPFTPLEARSRGRGASGGGGGVSGRGGGGDLPRLVIKEEGEEEGCCGEGNGGRVGVRLPPVGVAPPRPTSHNKPKSGGLLVRKQFRQSPGKARQSSQEEEGSTTNNNLGEKDPDSEQQPKQAPPPQETCRDLLLSMLSRSVPADQVIRQAEAILHSKKRGGSSLPAECHLPLSKLLFLLASDDANDRALSASSLPSEYLLLMGQMDLASGGDDAEAVLNSYGALRLLTHDAQLLETLCEGGLVSLLALHLKILCQQDQQRGGHLAKNIAFQATSCLRNCLNSPDGQAQFLRRSGGMASLDAVCSAFAAASREISCNLARLYSVLSQVAPFSGGQVASLHLLTSSHGRCDELLVRTAFALGNVAAESDAGRRAVLERDGLMEDLVDVLEERAKGTDKSKLAEDILVKLVRVFANLAVLPEAGMWAATSVGLNDCLVKLLSQGEAGRPRGEADEDDDYLRLSVLSAVCNLSYYPVVRHVDLYRLVVGDVFGTADRGMAAEAARAVGNLSRMREVRAELGRADTMARLMQRMEQEEEGGGREEEDLRFALVGTLVNVVADTPQKEIFQSLGGLALCVKWLQDCRCQNICSSDIGVRSGQQQQQVNWHLATLVCQLLWNSLTGLEGPRRARALEEVGEEVEEVLEELILLEREEEEAEETGPTEFSAVALQLLEKTRQELLKQGQRGTAAAQ